MFSVSFAYLKVFLIHLHIKFLKKPKKKKLNECISSLVIVILVPIRTLNESVKF